MKTGISSALLLLVVESSMVLFGQSAPVDRFWTAGAIRHAKGSATITSSDPRPLWMAMNALEREYGWAIDFDDPLWGITETAAQHNPQWESLHHGTQSRLPSGTQFQSTFAEDPTGIHSPIAVIRAIVDDYNKSGNPGRFEVHALPSGHIEVIGYSQESAHSTLDLLATQVSLPARNSVGRLEALNDLVNALSSASGIKVVFGVLPFNLLGRNQIAIPQGPTSARDILTLITDSGDVQLMWDLLYDFDSQSYFLSLRPRILIETDAIGNNIIVPQLKSDPVAKPQ